MPFFTQQFHLYEVFDTFGLYSPNWFKVFGLYNPKCSFN